MGLGRTARRLHTGVFQSHRSQGRVLLLLIGVVALLLLGALAGIRALRGSASATPDRKGPPAKAARVYQEKLDGQHYVNRDLGFTVEGPKEWKLALGARPEDAEPYEGLVVKMEAPGEPDPATLVRPLISVVKRTLAAGAAPDPASYIRRHLLGPEKTLIQEPEVAELGGRPVGKVVYEMKSAGGKIRIVQIVHVHQGRAIILSAMSPETGFAALRSTFEKVLESLKLDS